MKRRRRIIRIVSITFLVIAIAISILTPLTMNCWLVTTGLGFEIPDESSLLTFRATKMNSGSGEWWTYGEDGNFFYAASQTRGVRYHAFPRLRTQECPGFDRFDLSTWCTKITVDRPPKIRAEQGEDAKPDNAPS